MDRIRRIRHGKEGTAHPSSGRCSTDVLPLSSHYQTYTHKITTNISIYLHCRFCTGDGIGVHFALFYWNWIVSTWNCSNCYRCSMCYRCYRCYRCYHHLIEMDKNGHSGTKKEWSCERWVQIDIKQIWFNYSGVRFSVFSVGFRQKRGNDFFGFFGLLQTKKGVHVLMEELKVQKMTKLTL